MSDSSGFGQASPGQPDFDGPPGDSQSQSNLAGWTHVAGPQGSEAAGQPNPAPQGHPPQQNYPPPQSYPEQGYGQTPPAGAPHQLGQQSPQPPWQQTVGSQAPWQAGSPYQPTANQPTTPLPSTPLPSGYPPPQQPPRRAGRPVRGYLLAAAVIVALIVGLLGWQFLSPQLSGQPTVSATASAPPSVAASPAGTPQPTVVRTSPATQPTSSAPVIGGGVGQPVEFTTTGGSGTVSVTGAAWADNGILEPDENSAYLILNVTFEGVSGAISTGPFFTSVTDADDQTHMMTIGASLDQQLGMRTLRPGEQNSGQVAFELPRGPVTFTVRNELLESVATIDIPG